MLSPSVLGDFSTHGNGFHTWRRAHRGADFERVGERATLIAKASLPISGSNEAYIPTEGHSSVSAAVGALQILSFNEIRVQSVVNRDSFWMPLQCGYSSVDWDCRGSFRQCRRFGCQFQEFSVFYFVLINETCQFVEGLSHLWMRHAISDHIVRIRVSEFRNYLFLGFVWFFT